MLAYIRGEVAEMEPGRLIVENQGLGYELLVPVSDMEGLHVGNAVKVYTYIQLLEREGTFQTFGFLRKDSLELFRLLLTVSGIGPKAALGILSGLSPDTLRFAILSDDVKTISKAPGIGKKTAQKLILELKDKMDLAQAFEQKLSGSQEAVVSMEQTTAAQEAVEALTALGYSGTDALKAVRRAAAEDGMDAEEILRAALKFL